MTTNTSTKPTYTVNISCENCSRPLLFEVPLATQARSYLASEICKFCRCKLIQKPIRFRKNSEESDETNTTY